jgi:hypothetical protein
MSETYEAFYQNLSLQSARGTDPEEQLHYAVMALARFARDNRSLLLGLGRDILDGYQPTIKFLEENVQRHVRLLLNLIRKCQHQGLLGKRSVVQIIPFFIGSLAAPSVLAALLERNRLQPSYEVLKRLMIPRILSDAALEKRYELALQALR